MRKLHRGGRDSSLRGKGMLLRPSKGLGPLGEKFLKKKKKTNGENNYHNHNAGGGGGGGGGGGLEASHLEVREKGQRRLWGGNEGNRY